MHGEPPVPAWGVDPDMIRGLSMSIEAFMDLFPCNCHALCECEDLRGDNNDGIFVP
jgi:hypothetical protein